MELREALIRQSPSLELQRAAQAEIARLDAVVMLLTKEVQELQSELLMVKTDLQALERIHYLRFD